MSFLRRLFGGDADARPAADDDAPPATSSEIEATELEHERELLRAEAERLDDLRQRQLKYQQHAWTPPAQGGERRADEEDARAE